MINAIQAPILRALGLNAVCYFCARLIYTTDSFGIPMRFNKALRSSIDMHGEKHLIRER